MAYYIAPRFLDKLSVHITKNFLNLPGVRVPLILGIHGRKGEGKTFQCELVFEKMGIEVTMISGGELESPDAGDPARLIRLRYRETAELIKVRGKMCVLMINDLDAGAGRFDEGTQYTVNTQLVNATLMNIADNPTDVQLPGSYDSTPLCRVPIIVTGNDFSTLYAPLIRDGRMEKFYWEPDRDDKVGIVAGIFEQDGLSRHEVEHFVDTFAEQSIDFFSALRSRIYDELIGSFIHEVGFERVSQRVVNSLEGAPLFKKPNFGLSKLIEMGHFMVGEQQRVQNSQLVEEYNRGLYSRKPISASQGNLTKTDLSNSAIAQTTSNADYYKQYTPNENTLSPKNTVNTGTTQNTFDASKTYGTPKIAPVLSPSSTGSTGSTSNTFDASKTYGTPMKTPVLSPSSTVNGGSTSNTFDASKTYGTPMKTPELGTSSTYDASKTYGTFNRYNTFDLHNTTSSPSSHLTLETQELIREILAKGYKIALEHVDERRFRMGSWQSCTVGELNADSDAISAVEACLGEYSGEYIRLIGIEPVARKRVIETIIQRPNA